MSGYDRTTAAAVAHIQREMDRLTQAVEETLLYGEASSALDSQPAKHHGAVHLMGDSEALYLGTLLVESRR